jgi:ubiquinone/menaquinone biosynthesis C-methylase UbiE
MTTTDATGTAYVLERTPQEYERLRAQSRMWNGAASRAFEEVGLGAGQRCLDAGCGPGETMRLMADRVGSGGEVVGVDVDAPLLATTRTALHGEGYGQCDVAVHDVIRDEPFPRAPFDLVYARFLLLHLPQRVAVLRRLWNAVAPGGALLVQDYDLRGVRVVPPLESVDAVHGLLMAAMTAAGVDVSVGTRLPQLFAEADLGEPGGTDVAGLLQPAASAAAYLEATFRSVLPAALAHGLTTEGEAKAVLDRLRRDVAGSRGTVVLPLLVTAWKRKPAERP